VQETGGDPAPVLAVLRAALQFAARDEHDRLFPADAEFHAYLAAHGVAATLAHYCGLDSAHD
jgi:hypothetical protein